MAMYMYHFIAKFDDNILTIFKIHRNFVHNDAKQ